MSLPFSKHHHCHRKKEGETTNGVLWEVGQVGRSQRFILRHVALQSWTQAEQVVEATCDSDVDLMAEFF